MKLKANLKNIFSGWLTKLILHAFERALLVVTR